MAKRLDIYDAARLLIEQGYQGINGRVYYGEIYLNSLFKFDKCIRESHPLIALNIKNIKEETDLMHHICELSDETCKVWPDNHIIKSGRSESDFQSLKKEVLDTIFPFTDKQLILLNKLLYDNTNERSLFIITGIGGSGKSTFGNIVCQLFGDDVSHTMIDQLTGFSLAPALKSKLIYSDELGSKDLDAPILKQICSRQILQANNKYGSVEYIQAQSSMLFCCNRLPVMDITDTGLLRRLCYYHMNTKIQNPDPKMNHKVFTEDELIKIAMLAYNYPITDTWFEDNFQEETRMLIKKDNKIYKVIDKLEKDILFNKKLDYNQFKNACYEMGLKPYSEPTFNELMEVFDEWDKEESESWTKQKFTREPRQKPSMYDFEGWQKAIRVEEFTS